MERTRGADALTVTAPVVERGVKPSAPIGTCAQDAFGNRPVFEDRGLRRRAICAIGRQGARAGRLRPVEPRGEVLGGSSERLVLDVEGLPRPPAIGEAIAFVPTCAATRGGVHFGVCGEGVRGEVGWALLPDERPGCVFRVEGEAWRR